MKELTQLQKELVDFIRDYQIRYKVAPTFVEMASERDVTVGAVQSMIYTLERKKAIRRKNIYIIK